MKVKVGPKFFVRSSVQEFNGHTRLDLRLHGYSHGEYKMTKTGLMIPIEDAVPFLEGVLEEVKHFLEKGELEDEDSVL